MRHLMLTGSLITVSLILIGCADRPVTPDPPEAVACVNLNSHFACTRPNGKGFNVDYPGSAFRMHCMPLDDWEARKDWEDSLR